MEAFYGEIRAVHIGAVLTSGALFMLRGFGAIAFAAQWPMAAPVRYLSYTIDTVLLTAALMLMSITHQYPFVQAWLTIKVLALVVYIGLASLALKSARPIQVRAGLLIAALAVFAFIVSVARAHDPMGIFATGRIF